MTDPEERKGRGAAETGAPGSESAQLQRLVRAARADSEAARRHLHDVFMQVPFAVAVLEGPDHVFSLVNPAYQRILGPEREVLGLPVREALPELADQGYLELLDRVYATGEPFHGREMPSRLAREGGALETAHFNFVYAPYRDAEGRVAGVTGSAFEVTELVEARRRAEDLAAQLRDREELFRVAQEVSPIGFAHLRILRDEAGAADWTTP